MKSLTLLLLVVFQQSTEVKFFCNGKFYQFDLPAGNYQVLTSKYTEGTFTTYKYKTGEVIVLHVGGDVVKPFFSDKEDELTDTIRNEFGLVRKGINKRTKLFWQENISGDEMITLYFANVTKDRLEHFEGSVNSLHVTSVIR